MVRLLTYNVHRCVGSDGKLDVARVAEVIAAHAPDIVALQEVDVGRARTGGVDQAERLARRLGMAFHFNANVKVEEELYGDALLTVRPERLVKAGRLPGDPRLPFLEPRGALWVGDRYRRRGAAGHQHPPGPGAARAAGRRPPALAGPEWLGASRARGPADAGRRPQRHAAARPLTVRWHRA